MRKALQLFRRMPSARTLRPYQAASPLCSGQTMLGMSGAGSTLSCNAHHIRCVTENFATLMCRRRRYADWMADHNCCPFKLSHVCFQANLADVLPRQAADQRHLRSSKELSGYTRKNACNLLFVPYRCVICLSTSTKPCSDPSSAQVSALEC